MRLFLVFERVAEMILKSAYYGKTNRSAQLRLGLDYDKKVVSFEVGVSGDGEYHSYEINSFTEGLRCFDIADEWAKGNRGDDISEELYKAGYDEFSERFDLLWSILEKLPNKPARFWYDGSEILCRNEDEADAVANFIDSIIGDSCTHTGYYDPKEDERSGEVDDHTGYYYVDFD